MNTTTDPLTSVVAANDTLLFGSAANQMPSTSSGMDESIDYDAVDLQAIYGPTRDPLYVVIPITCIYVLIFLTGVVGNISTCIVISKNRSMHTATNYYLFSLAVSDFLLLMAGVPQEIYSIWSKYPYVFGEVFCVLRGLAAETAANATVLTITAFTVERYVAICHPFLSHTMSKLNRAVRLIVLVWVISIGMAIPQALQFGVISQGGLDQCGVKRIIIEHSFELSTFVFFIGPMSLITVLYVLIGLKLRSSSLMPRANGATLQRRAPHTSSLRQQTNQGTRRVLKMLVAVVVAFFLCWAPFHAQRLVAIYGTINDHLSVYVVMTYISGILYYLSTCINPLLYNLMSNKFREAFKETLANCCYVPERGDNKKRAYRVLSRGQRQWTGLHESTDYSGSSVRDESLYSTSTQKQSIDSSMIYSGCAAGSAHATHSKVSFEQFVKVVPAQDAADHRCPSYHEPLDHQQPNRHTANAVAYEATANTTHPIVGHRPLSGSVLHKKISFVNVRRQNHSKLMTFVHGLMFWRAGRGSSHSSSTRTLGYYSPPMEHQVAISRKTALCHHTCEYSLDEPPMAASLVVAGIPRRQNDDGAISNSSLQNLDEHGLEDELSAYMADLRKREQM